MSKKNRADLATIGQVLQTLAALISMAQAIADHLAK
jgi:hypothetical protein